MQSRNISVLNNNNNNNNTKHYKIINWSKLFKNINTPTKDNNEINKLIHVDKVDIKWIQN